MSMLKGMPVFDMKTGVIIGEVCDLAISSDGNVDGLLVKKGGFFKHSCLLDVHDIASFGSDGVMIEDAEKLKSIKTPPEYTFFHHQSLSGKMLYSRQGESLGMLKDVYFMEELGTIVGYEITDGFFSDISEGKRVIKSMQPATIGKDAIIVNVNTT
ncbi:PRC-barrel domain-containing protein [Bacillus sp. cl95]|uniref:PRC-barrel domain-containing protein n=1 Tax=unclassified Bacillus (in: firmicutes) TaxID=185979 RepID=UPI0034A4E00E